IEAGADLTRIERLGDGELPSAGPQGKEPLLPKITKEGLDRGEARKRAEVGPAVADLPSRREQSREIVSHRDLEIGICLIVFPDGVKERLVLFDQASFDQQRLALRLAQDVVDAPD